jgi:tRNA/rRNA methyltransferase
LTDFSSSAEALARVRVVLSHPQHPGNIGAAARAMKTMGLTRLVLVNPQRFPDSEATTRATGAADLLERAVVCASLDEALRGVVLAGAVSARVREVGPRSVTARVAAGELVERSVAGDVAIVFGNETSGLSNDEVMRCDRLVTIPTSADFSSLNLGSAVQLLSYEMRLAALGDTLPPSKATPFASPPATRDELEGFFGHLERVMIDSRFMDPAQPKRLLPKLRRLFARSQLEKDEVNILRGLLAALSAPPRGANDGKKAD